MDWIVTYRGKSGSQEQMSLEAESREAVFKELAKRGLTAIRIEQANGKAKLRKTSPKGGSKPSGAFKGAIAGIIVVIAAIGAWYFLTRGTGNGEQGTGNGEGRKIVIFCKL